MSSFFTLPASQRKRKKASFSSSSKKQKTVSKKRDDHGDDDEEVSSSDSDSGPRRADNLDDYESDSDSGHEGETAAERRLRLAQRYLHNIKTEVDEAGFDAADVDRDLIAERLKEDTALTKGKVYRFISDELDIGGSSKIFFRTDGNPVFAVAGSGDHIYTGRKDGSIVKWELPSTTLLSESKLRRPIKRAHTKGRMNKATGKGKEEIKEFVGHTGPILALTVSPSGKFMATGGKDKKIILWTTANMKPFRTFFHHRGPISGLAFKLQTAPANSQNKTTATETLYSASLDRSIKVWVVDKTTSAYLETLFGHQDTILSVDALFEDRCVSVGARDRTVRLWKVAEETQMVYRAGGCGALPKAGKAAAAGLTESQAAMGKEYHEGSTDCVAILDNELFVTGSDNGAISLWSSQKKKPIFTYPLAHGLDRTPRPHEYYADEDPGEVRNLKELPRGITALRAIPLSDFFVTGSWDGCVRAWKLRADRKGFVALGALGIPSQLTDNESSAIISGSDIAAPTDSIATSGPNAMDAGVSFVQQSASLCSPDSVPSLATSTLSLPSTNSSQQPSSSSALQFPSHLKHMSESAHAHLPSSSKSLIPHHRSSFSSSDHIDGIINSLAVFERGARGHEKVYVVAGVGKEHRLRRRLVVASETVAKDGKNGCVLFEISRSGTRRE